MTGTLYIVATPIGNLEDITLRAIRVLSEVDIILAEDTRVTRKLLSFLNTKYSPSLKLSRASGNMQHTELLSYHQHSKDSRKLEILRYLVEGKKVVLVTDAGTPGISDPGNELIDFLLDKEPETNIVPIPGASAIATALSVSGFNVNKFLFLGFLPKKKRKKLFEWIKEGRISFAFYESPKRILTTLAVLKEEFGGDKRIFVAREMTKLYETLYRGSVDEVIMRLNGKAVKGEVVVVVEG